MNGNPSDPNIVGIQGIIETYRRTLPLINLAGPTMFAPLLAEFGNYVQSMMASQTYQILLLLTDGAIHDMPKTIDIIV